MANPKNDVAFGRVVNVPPRGIGKTTLDKLAERAEALGIPLLAMAREASAVPGLKDRAARSLRDFGLLMDELVALRDHAAEEVIRRLLTLSGYREALAAEGPTGEDRLANLDELISAAREFDREHPGGSVVDFLEEISLASAVDRWKDDAGSVTLMTLHAAKGLEFPVAFIVGLEQGFLPALAGERERRRAGGGAPAPLRRDHPGRARAVPEPLPDPRVPGPEAGDDPLVLPRRASRGGHDRPRPDRRRDAPLEPVPLATSARMAEVDGEALGVPPDDRRRPARAAASTPGRAPLGRRPRGVPAGRLGDASRSTASAGSSPSTAPGRTARGGSPSRSGASGPSSSPSRRSSRSRDVDPRRIVNSAHVERLDEPA